MFPIIKNNKYYELSFEEIDKIRKKIINGECSIYVKSTQLYLYLNQMNKNYAFILSWVQNINIASCVLAIIFLFINLKIAIFLFIIFLISGFYSIELAYKFIIKNCLEDRVFLKFALSVELVKITDKKTILDDPIYKKIKIG